MARTFVGAGRRRQFPLIVSFKAEHLIYREGFFGVSNDDAAWSSAPTAADRPGVMILDGVWDLPARQFDASLANAGVKVYAAPTVEATTGLLHKNPASFPSGVAAIGRLWATYAVGASYLRVALFGPENQW